MAGNPLPVGVGKHSQHLARGLLKNGCLGFAEGSVKLTLHTAATLACMKVTRKKESRISLSTSTSPTDKIPMVQNP